MCSHFVDFIHRISFDIYISSPSPSPFLFSFFHFFFFDFSEYQFGYESDCGGRVRIHLYKVLTDMSSIPLFSFFFSFFVFLYGNIAFRLFILLQSFSFGYHLVGIFWKEARSMNRTCYCRLVRNADDDKNTTKSKQINIHMDSIRTLRYIHILFGADTYSCCP